MVDVSVTVLSVPFALLGRLGRILIAVCGIGGSFGMGSTGAGWGERHAYGTATTSGPRSRHMCVVLWVVSCGRTMSCVLTPAARVVGSGRFRRMFLPLKVVLAG